jgi:hypothetical protein
MQILTAIVVFISFGFGYRYLAVIMPKAVYPHRRSTLLPMKKQQVYWLADKHQPLRGFLCFRSPIND